MKLNQVKLYIAMFLMLMPLFSAYFIPENSEPKRNSCLNFMKQTFDSLAKGYWSERTCYSLPQTFGLLLYGKSRKTTDKVLSIIDRKPDNLYEILIDSFHQDITIHKVLIAKDPSNYVSYRAIFPKGKSVYKYVFDSVIEFFHNDDLWIIATDADKEETFIMITQSDFKRYVLPTKGMSVQISFYEDLSI